MFARAGIGVVDVSKNIGSPSVGEVKAMLTFAYPHDGARRVEAAEHHLHLSDVIDDVVEFWRGLARVSVVCGVLEMFAVLWTVAM